MNNDWRNELKEKHIDCYNRLCDCRNTRQDILTMAILCVKYNPTIEEEVCLDYIISWVGDWNNQYEVADMPLEEYKKMLKKLLTVPR